MPDNERLFAELLADLYTAAYHVLRSAAYESGEVEPTLHELNVNISALDELRSAYLQAQRHIETRAFRFETAWQEDRPRYVVTKPFAVLKT